MRATLWLSLPVEDLMLTSLLADPELTIAKLLKHGPGAMPVFLRHRMLCVGCPVTPFHTITDACREHGVDEAAFRAELAACFKGSLANRS
jgi:hybrid cluster-associated redox disulfide protein